MSKQDLSERDICTQFITPAIQAAGWDLATQVREEVSFTKGRIIVRWEHRKWLRAHPRAKTNDIRRMRIDVSDPSGYEDNWSLFR